MKRFALFAMGLALSVGSGLPVARADIVAQISISQQTLTLTVDGETLHVWPVSTARRGYITPKGIFNVQSMHKMVYSAFFNNAPMPHSIFYDGHYAIHGTTDVKKLGRPASAGCIRLHPDNARFLFDLVKGRGADRLQVIIDG
jgi:lipoprotein-anchoring transpeptidase ErfK/SrfK